MLKKSMILRVFTYPWQGREPSENSLHQTRSRLIFCQNFQINIFYIFFPLRLTYNLNYQGTNIASKQDVIFFLPWIFLMLLFLKGRFHQISSIDMSHPSASFVRIGSNLLSPKSTVTTIFRHAKCARVYTLAAFCIHFSRILLFLTLVLSLKNRIALESLK